MTKINGSDDQHISANNIPLKIQNLRNINISKLQPNVTDLASIFLFYLFVYVHNYFQFFSIFV